jgi:hypothetical protein
MKTITKTTVRYYVKDDESETGCNDILYLIVPEGFSCPAIGTHITIEPEGKGAFEGYEVADVWENYQEHNSGWERKIGIFLD